MKYAAGVSKWTIFVASFSRAALKHKTIAFKCI